MSLELKNCTVSCKAAQLPYQRLEDLIKNQGELALIIEQNKQGQYFVAGYRIPEESKIFSKKEKALALVQGIVLDEDDREKDENFEEKTHDKFMLEKKLVTDNNVETMADITKSVYGSKKYKPIALKVKPLIEQLPEKF